MHLTHSTSVCFRCQVSFNIFSQLWTSMPLQAPRENTSSTEWQYLYLTMYLSCSVFDSWSPLLTISRLPHREVLSSAHHVSLRIVSVSYSWCVSALLSLALGKWRHAETSVCSGVRGAIHWWDIRDCESDKALFQIFYRDAFIAIIFRWEILVASRLKFKLNDSKAVLSGVLFEIIKLSSAARSIPKLKNGGEKKQMEIVAWKSPKMFIFGKKDF